MIFTPFSAAPSAFGIGLKPANPTQFLYLNDDYPRYLDEKLALYEDRFSDVFMAQRGTLSAQAEAARLIQSNVSAHCPKANALAGRALPGTDLPPLARAALSVQDDLVLMQHGASGWQLSAASLCFPSSWRLDEKFGLPLTAIHGPVPLSASTHARIERIFDNLQPAIPVWRENWSISEDDALRHARGENRLRDKNLDDPASLFLRTEYQTLHKLPVSGAILFTIGIHTRALPHIAQSKDGRAVLAALADQIDALSSDERSYKGLKGQHERLVNWLRRPEEQNVTV